MDAELSASFQTFSPTTDKQFPYGTAGFRSDASGMRHVMHRSGMLAVLRAAVVQNHTVGLCITASHNEAKDNGVKLIDSDGGMLCQEFEAYACELINSKQPLQTLKSLAERLNIDLNNSALISQCRIIVGHDTRESSPALFAATTEGVKCLGAKVFSLGVVTTPQVHFAVEQCNFMPIEKAVLETTYYENFSNKFQSFISLCGLSYNCSFSRFLPERLVCDGANGVGAQRIALFQECLQHVNVSLEIRNDGMWPGDELNHEAGAEYVQKEIKLPKHFGPNAYDAMHLRCCALDGDADRLVYFSSDALGMPILVDGDKIGALYGITIGKLLKELIQKYPKAASSPLRFGAVQTAYANGSSTDFYNKLGADLTSACMSQVAFETACVKTGVKNLHHKAVEFDVAIYFESNGHGTTMAKLVNVEKWAKEKECETSVEYRRLHAYLSLFNQATGDAMTDVLAVEAALKFLSISFMEWARMYTDVACVQKKVKMSRERLNTLKPHPVHEKHLVEPAEIQTKLNQAVARYQNARAFIRPSGTEDVCRLYVEANNVANAEQLCAEIQQFLD